MWCRWLGGVAVAALMSAVVGPAGADDGRTVNQTVRVSLDRRGDDADGWSQVVDLSADGRVVLFQSSARDLTDEREQGTENAFVADLDTGEVEWIATGPFAPPSGENGSFGSSMSADGRYVVFSTLRPLVPEDRNGQMDVYRRDRVAGETVLVSASAEGGAANGASGGGRVSDDGRWVSFRSDARGIVEGARGFVAYVRDVEAGATRVAVRRLDGTPDDSGFVTELSADGRRALVTSFSDRLVAGDAADSARELYLVDLATGRTLRLGPGPTAVPAGDAVWHAEMTPDADVVLLHVQPVAGSSFHPGRLLVRDRSAGTLVEVDRGSRPVEPFTTAASLSDDGRRVAFVSASTDLVDQPEWRGIDVFVRDLATGSTLLVPVSRRGGAANGRSFGPVVDGDGSAVAFTSFATNLALPEDENVGSDVYWRKLERPA